MIFDSPREGQRFLAPEVVQTSAMDCGPAALKALLEGFDIPVSYGRLREACQTDVDGTSIDTLEDIAVQLGLEAEQVMIPADHLTLPEAQSLPAIVVVRLPNGLTHFLVVWGQVGGFLQVMDPATGRRWPTWKSFQNELYIHSFPVPADAWREWAGQAGMLEPLRRRLNDLGLEEAARENLIAAATADPGWRGIATLDAATRMVTALTRSDGLTRGSEACAALERFFQQNIQAEPPSDLTRDDGSPPTSALRIPPAYWSVIPAQDAPDTLILRGAVLVRILGRRAVAPPGPTDKADSTAAPPLSPDLAAALNESAYRPEREIWKALKEDGMLTPMIVGLSVLLATISVLVEALLLQGILQVGQNLGMVWQRLWAVIFLLAFILAPLLLEFPISTAVARLGRRLETRLRIALLEKIPRLGDRYFHSRLTSDMTQRAHDLRQLRSLPGLAVALLRTAIQLLLTMLGVIWLDPISAPLAILGTVFFIGLSFLTRPFVEERDLRLRTHIGALSRFYLDAMLGLVPVKAHGAERAMRRQYENQLIEWVRTGREFYTMITIVQSVGALLYSIFALAIVLNYIAQGGEINEILLLFYWTLNLPTLGQALASQVQQYPMLRNQVLRLLEPLGAPDEEEIWHTGQDEALAETPRAAGETAPQGVKIDFENVWLQAGGHVILRDIDLHIQPGEHLAVVGPSGAGKSSLVGLLLGWHRPAQGEIFTDDEKLDGRRIQMLRSATAWVDPAVQLWNRSLYENIRYGMEHRSTLPIAQAVEKANLYEVLERLPEGLKTPLGEGGGLVSGGEGQRVRLGRAILRSGVRLVILDEPFRGLDRAQRRRLLQDARAHWAEATLICITHDVSETLGFERVLVIEDGRIVEQGAPAKLSATEGARYQELLQAEEDVRIRLWEGANWRRFSVQNGWVQPTNGAAAPDDPDAQVTPGEELNA